MLNLIKTSFSGLPLNDPSDRLHMHKQGEVVAITPIGNTLSNVYFEYGQETVVGTPDQTAAALGLSGKLYKTVPQNLTDTAYFHPAIVWKVDEGSGTGQTLRIDARTASGTDVSENYSVGAGGDLIPSEAVASIVAKLSVANPLSSQGGTPPAAASGVTIHNTGDGTIDIDANGADAVVTIDNTGTGDVTINSTDVSELNNQGAGAVTVTNGDNAVVNNTSDGAITVDNGIDATVNNSGTGAVTINNA